MPPRLSWRNLIPGLIALTLLVVAVIGVLTLGGIGKVQGDTVRLHVLTDQARGVMAGSEVWLDGQKAGAVHHIGFRAPSADTLHRVVIAIDLREDAVARLRQDSRIQVRPGGSVIGPIVVFLESGTPSSGAVRPGDTLHAVAQSDAELAMESLGAATKMLPGLVADAKTVVGHTRNPDGTVGAFLTYGVPPEVARLRTRVAALRERAQGERDGAPGGALRERTSSVMARVDSIRALLAAPHTSFGRFRRDTTLPRMLGEISDDLAALERDMAGSPGTLPRLRTDSALTRAIADARREMGLLFEDVKRRPLRYINF